MRLNDVDGGGGGGGQFDSHSFRAQSDRIVKRLPIGSTTLYDVFMAASWASWRCMECMLVLGELYYSPKHRAAQSFVIPASLELAIGSSLMSWVVRRVANDMGRGVFLAFRYSPRPLAYTLDGL